MSSQSLEELAAVEREFQKEIDAELKGTKENADVLLLHLSIWNSLNALQNHTHSLKGHVDVSELLHPFFYLKLRKNSSSSPFKRTLKPTSSLFSKLNQQMDQITNSLSSINDAAASQSLSRYLSLLSSFRDKMMEVDDVERGKLLIHLTPLCAYSSTMSDGISSYTIVPLDKQSPLLLDDQTINEQSLLQIGKIAFKRSLRAPSITFMIHSLSNLLFFNSSVNPTRLMKIVDDTGLSQSLLAISSSYYLNHKQSTVNNNETELLSSLLHQSDAPKEILAKISIQSFSLMMIMSLICDFQNVKPDSLLVVANKSDHGNLLSIDLLSIDTDLAFLPSSFQPPSPSPSSPSDNKNNNANSNNNTNTNSNNNTDVNDNNKKPRRKGSKGDALIDVNHNVADDNNNNNNINSKDKDVKNEKNGKKDKKEKMEKKGKNNKKERKKSPSTSSSSQPTDNQTIEQTDEQTSIEPPFSHSMRNFLFLLPQMNEVISRDVRDMMKEVNVEKVLIEWILLLARKNKEYQTLLDNGVFDHQEFDLNLRPQQITNKNKQTRSSTRISRSMETGLQLPIKFSPGLISSLYHRLTRLVNLLRTGPVDMTHLHLFSLSHPSHAKYYSSLLLSNDISSSFYQLYMLSFDRGSQEKMEAIVKRSSDDLICSASKLQFINDLVIESINHDRVEEGRNQIMRDVMMEFFHQLKFDRDDQMKEKGFIDWFTSKVDLINKTFFTNSSIIHWSVENDHLPLTLYLISSSIIDPNQKNHGSYTPLHIAASMGNIKMIELLLENGANPNATDKLGKTALDKAISRHQHKAASTLKKAMEISQRQIAYDESSNIVIINSEEDVEKNRQRELELMRQIIEDFQDD